MTCSAIEDPAARQAGNHLIASLRVVINRDKKGQDGKYERGPGCFIDVDCWGWLAEMVQDRVRKGAKLFIDGRLDFQEWEAKDGGRRSKHLIVADRIEIVELPPRREQRTNSNYSSTDDRPSRGARVEADIPF